MLDKTSARQESLPMKLLGLFSIILFLFFSCSKDSVRARLDLSKVKLAREVDPRFLSFSLDTALLVGSYWWNETGEVDGARGKEKIAPYNIASEELIAKAQALAPAYFRVGGSEADKLFYQLNPETKLPNGYDSTLTPKHLKSLRAFIERSGLDLFFTLNSGPEKWKNGSFESNNLLELIDYFKKENYPLSKLEFGNEVLAYWVLFGVDKALDLKAYGKAYRQVKKELAKRKTSFPIAAPASAFWPVLGEPFGEHFGQMKDIVSDIGPELDIITWHYYPTQSSRCPVAVRRMSKNRFLDPAVLDEVEHWAQELSEMRDAHAPQAQLWLGETGSAQCGGQINQSDTFLSGFWWLDQLGILALEDHDVIIRQALVGGDYGLLSYQDLRPRPDYWNSLLWKRLMGTKVLRLHTGDTPYRNQRNQIRLYAHCHPSGGASIVYLNLTPNQATLNLDREYQLRLYKLNALSLDAKELTLNGAPINETNFEKNFENASNAALFSSEIQLPKRSYGFVRVLDAAKEICR